MRSGGVEEADLLRVHGIGDVIDLEARRMVAGLGDLVGLQQDVAAQAQRVAAHPVVRQRQLPDHLGIGRLGHVEDGEADRRVLVGEIHDPAPVAAELHRDAFAGVGMAADVAAPDQLQVVGEAHFGVVGGVVAHG
jgi:hypothetical protein